MSICTTFSIEERKYAREKVNRALRAGILKEPTKCEICNQDKGIIEYYISDYRKDKVLSSVKPLCWTCHRMIILEPNIYKQAEKYFEEVRNGKTYPPVEEDDPMELSKIGVGMIYYYSIFGGLKFIW